MATGNETWVSHLKLNVSLCTFSSAIKTQKVPTNNSNSNNGNNMLEPERSFARRVPRRVSINSDSYCEALRKLLRSIQRRTSGLLLFIGVVIVSRKNTRSRVVEITKQCLQKCGWKLWIILLP